MKVPNLKLYLRRYLAEHKVPPISSVEASYLATEITRGVEILLANPDIDYDRWWEEIHSTNSSIN